MSVADIAFRVGYPDPPRLEHAFRCWTGDNPRQVRHLGHRRQGIAGSGPEPPKRAAQEYQPTTIARRGKHA